MGTLFVDYVRMLRARKDIDWAKYFTPSDLPYLTQRIAPDAWYPMETFERMGLAILDLIAQKELETVKAFGAASVDWLAEQHPALLEKGDPRESIMRFQVLRQSFFDFPALEVLVSTARIRECIADKDRTKEIHDAISKGYTTYGMQTFDQSLMQLVKSGLVTYDEALKHVSNRDDFALRFRGIASTSDGTWDDFEKDEEEGEEGGENASASAAPGKDRSDASKPDTDIDIERF